MGEIAEGLLDGTFDSLTGEYLGEGPGYPRTTDREHAELTGTHLVSSEFNSVKLYIVEKYLNYGHISFIKKKNLKHKDIIKWLKQNHYDEIQVNKKNHIVNISSIIKENWDSFHQWIDQSIKSGEISGKRVSLADKEYWKNKKEFAKALSNLSPEIKSLKNRAHKALGGGKFNHAKAQDFNNFWCSNRGLANDPKEFTPRTQETGYRLEPHYQFIIDKGLEDQFIDFLKNNRYSK